MENEIAEIENRAGVVERDLGGRPTKFNEEIINKTLLFIEEYKKDDERFQLLKSEGKTTAYENKIKPKIPTLENLALHLNIDPETLRIWAKARPQFSALLKQIQLWHYKKVSEGAIAGDYEPRTAAILLNHKHGIQNVNRDTPQGGNNITFNFVNYENKQDIKQIIEKVKEVK